MSSATAKKSPLRTARRVRPPTLPGRRADARSREVRGEAEPSGTVRALRSEKRARVSGFAQLLLSSFVAASLTLIGLTAVAPWVLQRGDAVVGAGASADVRGTPAGADGAQANRYTVRPGDSLALIAQQQLGDLNRWPELFDANRDRLTSPTAIEVGMTLRLPNRR